MFHLKITSRLIFDIENGLFITLHHTTDYLSTMLLHSSDHDEIRGYSKHQIAIPRFERKHIFIVEMNKEILNRYI